jgi:hypothetical protein
MKTQFGVHMKVILMDNETKYINKEFATLT